MLITQSHINPLATEFIDWINLSESTTLNSMKTRSSSYYPLRPGGALVRVVKAEDGGLGGKGIWQPATTGLSPANENEVMKRDLAGGFVGAYSSGEEPEFEED